MKHLLLLAISAFTFSSNAQEFTFTDNKIEYKNEIVQSINVILTPRVETIKDKFEDWMDDKYEVDLDGTTLLFFDKDVMSAEGVVIPKISTTKVDLHVKVDETDSGKTDLNVFASFGYNNWISEYNYPYEYIQLKNIVQEFITEYLPQYYMSEIKDNKESLSNLNSKAEDLNQEMANNIKEIEKLKQENSDLLKKMQSNQSLIRRSEENLKISQSQYRKVNQNVKKMNSHDTKGK